MENKTKFGSYEKDKEFRTRWNRTVNVFRRIAGLEPFLESDEESSTSQNPEVDNSQE